MRQNSGNLRRSTTNVRNTTNKKSATNMRSVRQRRARKRRRRIKVVKYFCAFAVELALCVGILAAARSSRSSSKNSPNVYAQTSASVGTYGTAQDLEQYPEELRELLELNEEALDYVESYPNREEYKSQPIDLTEDFHSGQVPLLMQWDRRWGYDAYGDSMIGLAGCGPVCLDMAYLYFTEDTGMTPREMAVFAYDNGYYTEYGTSWALWTEGAEKLGLSGATLSLDEREMKRALSEGGLIVCSMRPGDFTTTGHFILLRGYDDNGFYVNDPNRRSNSEKQWDFETLRYQIKNLWVLQK